jgi:L-malate glycosyltransferase
LTGVKKDHQKLRILHLSTAATWRGGEQQVAYLVEELAKRDIWQQVCCAAGSAMAKYCLEKGIPHFTCRKIFSINPLVAWRVARFCRRQKITHVHAHDSHAHTYAVMAASLFGNAAPIAVSRRVDFPVGNSFLSRWKYNHLAVAKIVCVSAFIKGLTAPALRDPGKLTVVHSGIDVNKFGHDKSEGMLRATYGVKKDEFLIANIAALAPHKDHRTFVRAAEMLVREGFPARFLLIGGDGGEEQNIRRMIGEKGLEAHVLLTGFRGDVPQILPEIDLLLFTSKTEGLGTSLLDAFASGVPVVATSAGGIPEIMEHGHSGMLAPPGDAGALALRVKEVLTHPALWDELVRHAAERVRLFTKEKMAEKMISVYSAIR